MDRAIARGIKTGRVVPEEVIRGTHASVSRVMPQAIDAFDSVKLFDTTQGARLIAEGERGAFNVLDPVTYAKFLAKADE